MSYIIELIRLHSIWLVIGLSDCADIDALQMIDSTFISREIFKIEDFMFGLLTSMTGEIASDLEVMPRIMRIDLCIYPDNSIVSKRCKTRISSILCVSI